MTTLQTHAAPADPRSTPPAVRARATAWRDPRLIIGIALVAVCVLLGARVVGAADDSVAVWSLRHDVPAGETVTGADLAIVRVHFSGRLADRYFSPPAAPVPGSTAAHDLAAGELLPRSAVTADDGADLVEVPLSVAPDDLPASVRRGAVVDVWVTPKAATTGDDHVRARLALDDVVVVAVPSSSDSLAPRTTQQVIVGVAAAEADDAAGGLAAALGELADGRVVLTRQAGS